MLIIYNTFNYIGNYHTLLKLVRHTMNPLFALAWFGKLADNNRVIMKLIASHKILDAKGGLIINAKFHPLFKDLGSKSKEYHDIILSSRYKRC